MYFRCEIYSLNQFHVNYSFHSILCVLFKARELTGLNVDVAEMLLLCMLDHSGLSDDKVLVLLTHCLLVLHGHSQAVS